MEGRCPVCGAVMTGDHCEYCGYAIPKKAPEQMNYTVINNYNYQQDGQQYENGAPVDLQQPGYVRARDAEYVRCCSPKSWTAALVLCILLGVLGVHRFYVGKIGTGLLWLFTGGMFGIGWIVDLVLIATGNFTDGQGLPLKM